MRLPHGQDLPLPSYQSALAAGMDLVAAVPADAPLALSPGARALVPTGIAIALPAGTEAQVRPRSGLAIKHGLTVLNAPGTIDADYRGEIQVLLVNLGGDAVTIARGMRIAQLVVATVARAQLLEVGIARPNRARSRRIWLNRQLSYILHMFSAGRTSDCSLLPAAFVVRGAKHADGVPQGRSCHCRRNRRGDQRPQPAGFGQGAGGAP